MASVLQPRDFVLENSTKAHEPSLSKTKTEVMNQTCPFSVFFLQDI
jgi:hypothetical protein